METGQPNPAHENHSRNINVNDRPPRIAIVGCGAVTERAHLPGSVAANVPISVLVDKDRARADQLARQYGIPSVLEDYMQLEGKAEGAIVALPHGLHAEASIALLRRGIPVLVEKPMALSASECDQMIQAASQSSQVLAVGLMRRFLRSALFAKDAIASGLLGNIESFDVRDGFIQSWPVASPAYYQRRQAGGGTLMDFGAHALDSLLWWLGEVASFDYFDDNHGGVEADCELRLVMKSGAKGIVELSRTRNLRRTAILVGDRAMLEVGLHTNQVRLRSRTGNPQVVGQVSAADTAGEQSYVDLMAEQLRDFLDAIRDKRPPRVPGTEGRRSVVMIEACYARRKPLELPWLKPAREPSR
jgi:predicted dehydrogenase